MADKGIRTRYFWLANHGDAHTYVFFKELTVLQYARAQVCVYWAVSGKMKTPTTELKIFFSIFFRRKLKSCIFIVVKALKGNNFFNTATFNNCVECVSRCDL